MQFPSMKRSFSVPNAPILNISDVCPTANEMTTKTCSSTGSSKLQADFHGLELIGEGGFGKVFKGISHSDDRTYAIKIQNFRLQPHFYFRAKEVYALLMREARILAKLDHENVVRYYSTWLERHFVCKNAEGSLNAIHEDEYYYDEEKELLDFVSNEYLDDSLLFEEEDVLETHSGGNQDPSFDGEEQENQQSHQRVWSQRGEKTANSVFLDINVFIQMGMYDGKSLREWLANRETVNQRENIGIVRQLLHGLQYIHSMGLVHRDIKPDNILMTTSRVIKIADFGLAKEFIVEEFISKSEDKELGNLLLKDWKELSSTSGAGTPLYASPEQLQGKSVDFHSDIFSLGVVLCEMWCIFSTTMERHVTLNNLRRGVLPSEIEVNYPLAADVIKWVINEHPLKRPDCNTLLSALSSFESKHEISQEYLNCNHSTNLLMEDNDLDIHHEWQLQNERILNLHNKTLLKKCDPHMKCSQKQKLNDVWQSLIEKQNEVISLLEEQIVS